MPATKKVKKAVQPVAPAPPPPSSEAAPAPVAVVPGLPILYPELVVDEYSTTSKKGPIDVEWAKQALGWETEGQYKERKLREEPGSKPEMWTFGDTFHCRDRAGQKVRCHHNANNRPFDERWCEDLIHTILYGQWAGPHTVPGETVNGETVRISKYGRVLSGQHQLTALILAAEILAKARADKLDHPDSPKYPTWKSLGAPFLETIVVKGMSEDPRVLMTVDYVKPRTAADVFYTSDAFRSSSSVERKELCRMLAVAVDFLWTRTDARGYKTHPEIVAFLDRHKKLLLTVIHIFEENRPSPKGDGGRRLTKLRLSPGQCAALEYVMATCGPETDGDAYRNEEPAPSEKNIDWSLWDRAQEFWTLLGDTSSKLFLPVRTALGRLVGSDPTSDENQGLGGRLPEKLAILARAWEVWRECGNSSAPFTMEDLAPGGVLCLSYTDVDDKGNALPEGQIKLVDVADFMGIDSPEVTASRATRTAPPDGPAPTPEDIERLTQEALKRRQAAAK